MVNAQAGGQWYPPEWPERIRALAGGDLTPVVPKRAATVMLLKDTGDSSSSGRGWGWGYGGGYRSYGGYGGGGGGGGSYAPNVYFTKMNPLPGSISTYGNATPFINTSNPIIRRADVRRERVWSERGRLKQWQ